jgi:pimeloyl-ACP methyl ester carboxylesterase/DNA-binding CsgD family transcriptional regulator
MDMPTVQYVTTPDGVKLAYAVRGKGLPVIFLPFHFSSLEFRWNMAWLGDVSQHACVAAYDGRGQGLSTRNLDRDFTVADFRRDLETVIEAVGFQKFVLAAYGGFGHVAVGYAVEYPERVHALVLICTAESFAAYPWLPMLPLAEENWDLFLRLQLKNIPAHVLERVLSNFKSCTTPEDYGRMIRGFAASDISDALPALDLPVLMIHSLRQHWLSPDEGAKLAAKVRAARIFFPDDEGEIEPEPVQGAKTIIEFLKGLPPIDQGEAMGLDPYPTNGELSHRQSDVLCLIADGKTTREIAGALVLSERTVERHIADIYAKIGARNRAEATAFYLRTLNLRAPALAESTQSNR